MALWTLFLTSHIKSCTLEALTGHIKWLCGPHLACGSKVWHIWRRWSFMWLLFCFVNLSPFVVYWGWEVKMQTKRQVNSPNTGGAVCNVAIGSQSYTELCLFSSLQHPFCWSLTSWTQRMPPSGKCHLTVWMAGEPERATRSSRRELTRCQTQVALQKGSPQQMSPVSSGVLCWQRHKGLTPTVFKCSGTEESQISFGFGKLLCLYRTMTKLEPSQH